MRSFWRIYRPNRNQGAGWVGEMASPPVNLARGVPSERLLGPWGGEGSEIFMEKKGNILKWT